MRRTGCGLLGHEDDAEAALADLLQQLVRSDDVSHSLSCLRAEVAGLPEFGGYSCGDFEETTGSPKRLQEPGDPLPKGRIRIARPVEVCVSRRRVANLKGFNE